MIEIIWKTENYNVLKINYDFHPDRLINSFRDRKYAEKVLSQ